MFSLLNIFRGVAFLEGVSYILLLFIATPIKHFAGNEQFVKLLGMPHGVLFVLYIVLAIMLKNELKWNTKQFAIVLVASILPFGTFYVEKTYLKPQSNG
jgi:integral membrane protein